MNHLKHHRQPNMDLKIEYKKACKGWYITNEWTKGHQDDYMEWNTISKLQNMKLSNTAILNTIPDKRANEPRRTHITCPDLDVFSSKKWVLFSTTPYLHKIIG